MPAIELSQSVLTAGFQAQIASLLATQKQLGALAAAQLQSLAAQLAPLAQQLAFELTQGDIDPARTQEYLNALGAIVGAEAATLGIQAIETEKQAAANAIAGLANSVASALKDPTTQMLIKAAVGIGLAAL